MADAERTGSKTPTWPAADGASSVPYWIFQRQDELKQERDRLSHGPVWNYLCLKVETANTRNFVAVHVDETPVIVARDNDIHACENRCARHDSFLALEDRGNAKDFTWSTERSVGSARGPSSNGLNSGVRRPRTRYTPPCYC